MSDTDNQNLKRYQVLIEETLARCVEVDAYDSSDAHRQAQKLIDNEEVILTADDYTSRNIMVVKEL